MTIAGIDHATGPHGALTIDAAGSAVTPEVVAGIARDHEVLLTELRRSESEGLEALYLSLTARPTTIQEDAA